MRKIRIGIIGTADIAEKKMIPALKENADKFEYVGVASRSDTSGEIFVNKNGGRLFVGYESMLLDKSIDAVYVPLPPALHFKWVKQALEHGKHVLCEKPFMTNYEDAKQIVELAQSKQLVVNENFMFIYHRQINAIRSFMESGEIGKTKFIRSMFTFPRRSAQDFRYNKELGGGALLDAGCYTIKLLTDTMNMGLNIMGGKLIRETDGLDIGGMVWLSNPDGVLAEVSFGMDHTYNCSLDAYGTNGIIRANRIFTAPKGFGAEVCIEKNGEVLLKQSYIDDHFSKSLIHFWDCVNNDEYRNDDYSKIIKQSKAVQIVQGF